MYTIYILGELHAYYYYIRKGRIRKLDLIANNYDFKLQFRSNIVNVLRSKDLFFLKIYIVHLIKV